MKLLLTWLATFAFNAVCAAGLVNLWSVLGLTKSVALLLFLFGSIVSCPLEALASFNILSFTLVLETGFPLFQKVGLFFASWALLGFYVATSLIIFSKFGPIMLKRLLVSLTLPSWGLIHDLIDALLPQSLQYYFGILFTLVTELCIIPGAAALLYLTAKLKYAGENFDFIPYQAKPRNTKRKVLVLIHGRGFNECQWHFSRILMQARGWHESMEILTVNYLKGPILRTHCENSSCVPSCSRIAFSQIQTQLKLRGIEDPEQVVLMGHSLGGVISSYIKENLAKEIGLNITHVIAISAPIGGSAILEWAHGIPFLRRMFKTDLQFQEFFPGNEVMSKLQEKMSKDSSSYFGITGRCDPLVRPPSALDFASPQNQILIPCLGHYNIKISNRAWRLIISHVEAAILTTEEKEVK